MPGKKRKLKKELKRKLRKETKKKENKDNKVTKVDKSKVEKQVIDNQTLQQIMMAQMMNSRDRLRKGEDVSWTTVQNQYNADKIKHKQEINALKAENQELERKAKNIEENEKYKEVVEKLKQEVEEKKKAIEQAQEIIPLKEQVRELEAQRAELEQKINDPLNQMQLQKTNLENYIKHLKETVDAKDPAYKEMSDKIAEYKATLKKLKEREQLIETRNQLNTELENKRSEMKAAFKQLRAEYPKELSGIKWNSEDIDKEVKKIIDKITTDIAKNETTLKKYKEQEQINEEYAKVAGEFKRKEAEMKADMEYIRQQIPDYLTGVAWNAKDRDEKILAAKHKAAMERDNMNKQLEIMKDTSEEMKIINQTKADRDIYEENIKKKHPLFYPIYEKNLMDYGENRTVKDETEALIVSLAEYESQMKNDINTRTEVDEKLDKLENDENEESDESGYFEKDGTSSTISEEDRMESAISEEDNQDSQVSTAVNVGDESSSSYVNVDESDSEIDKKKKVNQ